MSGGRMNNCPNCGAPIAGTKCEYCGTVFNKNVKEARTLLELENECIKNQMSIERLYEEAIFAMRAYNSGIFTMNEAREHIGLERL